MLSIMWSYGANINVRVLRDQLYFGSIVPTISKGMAGDEVTSGTHGATGGPDPHPHTLPK
jgi:hypothetical protein